MEETIYTIISLAFLVLILFVIPSRIVKLRISRIIKALILFTYLFILFSVFINSCYFLAPIENEIKKENYVSVKALFATNRKAINEPTLKFTNERDSLKYGITYISIPNDHKIGEIESPVWWKFEFKEDPEKHITVLSKKIVTKDQFFNYESSNYSQKLLLFVHGYNVSFEEAAKRTGQMTYDMNFEGIPIFFSWPSKGLTATYTHDAENIEYSIRHITQFLNQTLRNYPKHEIFIIAHSMGTRGLTKSLINIYSENEEYKKRITHVFLAAPDIDAQIFKENIAPKIISEDGKFTLYSSSKDKALIASKEVNGFPRAGDSGKGLVVMEGIETIDASNINTGFLSHSYFGDSRSVISDIDQIIDHRLPADDRFGLEAVILEKQKYWKFRK